MSLNKIVFDLETQKNFAEVGGKSKHHLLRVSVLVAYSYQDDKYHIFTEKNIHDFGEMLQEADQVIGYNINSFDMEVLRPYFQFDLSQVPTLDLLEEVERSLGHRLRLEAIAQATLGEGKSGTGLNAITLWREGKHEELAEYCKRDVEVTRRVYEYGAEHGKLLFQDFFETREIKVSLPEAKKRENVVKQSSLF